MKITDKLCWYVAQYLPNTVVKWAFIRVLYHSTTGKYNNTEVPKLLATDAFNRWLNDTK